MRQEGRRGEDGGETESSRARTTTGRFRFPVSKAMRTVGGGQARKNAACRERRAEYKKGCAVGTLRTRRRFSFCPEDSDRLCPSVLGHLSDAKKIKEILVLSQRRRQTPSVYSRPPVLNRDGFLQYPARDVPEVRLFKARFHGRGRIFVNFGKHVEAKRS